jgi:hypothetical protein
VRTDIRQISVSAAAKAAWEIFHLPGEAMANLSRLYGAG